MKPSLCLFIIYAIESLTKVSPTNTGDCNTNAYPQLNGVWKNEPPYWRSPGCVSEHFSTSDSINCMSGRTLYVIGNSVARQGAFEMVELLGGDHVSREHQKEACPKNDATWGESCHQNFQNVTIKYLYLNYIDGFNYSTRGGFPFWKWRDKDESSSGSDGGKWKVGLHPKEKKDYPEYDIEQSEDNCIHHTSTFDCLSEFFQNSTDNDVLIFTIGMAYYHSGAEKQDNLEIQASENQDDTIVFMDIYEWLRASTVAYASYVTTLFHGHIFHVMLAPINSFLYPKYKHLAKMTPYLRKFNDITFHACLPWSTSEVSNVRWHTIDQWAINEGRHHFYNDFVHFVGPLTSAMLFQVLNRICPGGGSSTRWPQSEYAGYMIQLNMEEEGKDVIKSIEKESLMEGNGAKTYFNVSYGIDCLGYSYAINDLQDSTLNSADFLNQPHIPLNYSVFMIICDASCNGEPRIVNGMVIRKASGKSVYLVSNCTLKLFDSFDAFASRGRDFSEVVSVRDEEVAGLSEGEILT